MLLFTLYDNQMGLLRLYFALSVLLGHIDSLYLLSPIYAVNGFYILSGFYMSMILNEKYDKPDLNLLFYKRRFMRLLPTYWLLAIFHLIIAMGYSLNGNSSILFFNFSDFPSNASVTTYLYIIFSNIVVIGQDLALFLGISPEDGNIFLSPLSHAEQYPMPRYMLIPVAWPISIEFLFYLIAPFILRNRPKRVFIILVLSIVSNLVTNYFGLNNSNWRFRFFPSTLLFFLTGYLAYILYKRYNHLYNNYIFYKIRIPVTFGVLILLTLLLKLETSFASHLLILLLICIISIPYLFRVSSSSRSDRLIGELSYPIYLIHPIFIGIDDLLNIDSKLFIVFGSIIGAYLCYQLYIKPLEKMRAKLK